MPTDRERLLHAMGITDARVMDPVDTNYIDEVLLDDQGQLRVLPAVELSRFDPSHLRLWCHKHAVYSIPSLELVEWIKGRIGERSALEIAAGNGALGRALGIPMTDSYMQRDPDVAAYYLATGQPTVNYGADVQRRNANAAVRLVQPQVVVAAWATHIARQEEPERGGNVFGIDELKILEQVETYIHVGDAKVHAKKRWTPTEVLRYDWLFGRGRDRVILVWERS